MIHQPVLPVEVLGVLRPERGGVFVDATLGMGGHAALVIEKATQAGRSVTLLGIDQDEEALALAKQRLGERIEYLPGNFSQIFELVTGAGYRQVDGILMDFGVSSYQIDTPERGFSFQQDGPLDMRMDIDGPVTAAEIINTWPEFKLTKLFFTYGEERFAKRIARMIVEDRVKKPFTRTQELAELLVHAYPPALRHRHPHPATRVFQALRIEVNKELEVLREGLAGAVALLAPGGILAAISFHSLEDRLVKHFFRDTIQEHEGVFELVTRKPIIAGEEEAKSNSRSRSAKLRGLRRIE